MDDQRFGLALRALRRRVGWRQKDLASRARVRQQEVSDAENGRIDQIRVGSIRRMTGALDARAGLELLWRGGAIDRLIDRRHAELVERAANVLLACGWQVRAEVSFSIYGDRGSIDLLAWHEGTRSALIVEVKTELTSIEETLRRLDVKERLAPRIVQETLGWTPTTIGTLLVLPESGAARRRLADQSMTFATRFPDHARQFRAWLRNPSRPFAAVWFLPRVPMVGTKRRRITPHRVRVPKVPLPVTG